MEPSISCGTVAEYGTHLHCVVCREGTYSNSYGKELCTPCSLCSVGRTVTRNCSATKNTLCGPCSYGYYMNDVVLSCLRCSICCWDGKDQFENQCKAQGLPKHRQCKPRHDDGCQWSTTKTATSGRVIVITTNPAATPQTRKPRTSREERHYRFQPQAGKILLARSLFKIKMPLLSFSQPLRVCYEKTQLQL